MFFGKQKFDVKQLKLNKFIFDVKQLKMNRFIKSISDLIIITSNATRLVFEKQAVCRCSAKWVFLDNSQNSQENTWTGFSF